MENKAQSPKIHSIQWGKVTLSDGNQYKDVKLFPGGAREWDWTETGTHHRPGIQPADIEELLQHGAEAIVLSRGYHKRLQIKEDTVQLLEEKGISYFILETEEAVRKYNSMQKKGPVGCLIHSTC